MELINRTSLIPRLHWGMEKGPVCANMNYPIQWWWKIVEFREAETEVFGECCQHI